MIFQLGSAKRFPLRDRLTDSLGLNESLYVCLKALGSNADLQQIPMLVIHMMEMCERSMSNYQLEPQQTTDIFRQLGHLGLITTINSSLEKG